jgi:hypothetical protein
LDRNLTTSVDAAGSPNYVTELIFDAQGYLPDRAIQRYIERKSAARIIGWLIERTIIPSHAHACAVDLACLGALRKSEAQESNN